MEAPIRRGKEAMITDAIRQLNVKAITNAVTVSATFCTMVERRSASALLTNVASAANFDVKEPVLFSSKSNQPISLERIAAVQNMKQMHIRVKLPHPREESTNGVIDLDCEYCTRKRKGPENINNRMRVVRRSPINV